MENIKWKTMAMTAVGSLCLGIAIGIASNVGVQKTNLNVYEVGWRDVKTDGTKTMMVDNRMEHPTGGGTSQRVFEPNEKVAIKAVAERIEQ